MAGVVTLGDWAFAPVGVELDLADSEGGDVIRVVKPRDNMVPDVPTYARAKGIDFHDGTIDVDVRARLSPWADVDCRGFIGIAFRANAENSQFEGFYVRPRNGRSCTDPRRRAHAMQYFSYPGRTFAYFRERGIADFEAPADIDMDEWVHMRAEVNGAEGRFFVGNMGTPALVVPHMFHGADARGGVGLYVDNGTDGLFRNLHVRLAD